MIKLFVSMLLMISPLFPGDLFVQKGHYTLSYDELSLPGGEDLGLLGSSYLYDFDSAYLGVGIYSAVSGKRGGFFTGGLEAGYRYDVTKDISLDAGLFVGGGGGGSAPQGGGLMLRPHISVSYELYGYKLGFGYSKVKFPNGDIDSDQVYLQFVIPFQSVHKKNTNSPMIMDDLEDFMKTSGKSIGWSSRYFAITLQRYMIPSGVRDTSGALVKKDMSLIGFEYGRYFSKHIFGFLETAGAAGGGADGYAEVLGGVGYRVPIFKNMSANAKVSLGAAGGGRVDTSGGVVHKETLGLHVSLNKKFAIDAELGHMQAIDGDFKATAIKFGFNYKFNSLEVGKGLKPLNSYESFGDYEWNINLSNQRYFSDKNIRKGGSDSSAINLIGFEIDKLLDNDFYFTGEALGAYSGNSGGYAVGLIGIGKRKQITKKFDLFTKMLVGVAGGGGVSTGSGLVFQPMVGLGYRYSNSIGIRGSFGRVKAMSGSLDTFVFDLGISYKFKSIN